MGRPIETVLGIVGGILGIVAGLAVALVGGIGEAFVQIPGATDLYTRAALTIAAAVMGITAAVFASSTSNKKKISGLIMMAAAVLGSIGAGVFYFLSAASLGIAGIVAFVKKPEPSGGLFIQCPNCGASIEPFSKFCVKCDAPVQLQQ